MHVRNLLSLIAVLLTFGSLSAQDIHFTQFNMSPLTTNPANIGGFEGTVRFGGIYRGQWASVVGSSNQYSTPSAWADAPVFSLRKRDWISLGLAFFSDKAGSLAMKHNESKIGASYHLSLDKRSRFYLTAGFNFTGASRNLDKTNAKFGDGFSLTSPTQSLDYQGLATQKQTYKDFDAGLIFSGKLNKQMDFNIGFAMFHLLKPSYTLIPGAVGGGPNPPPTGGAKQELPVRSLLHGTFNIATSDRLTLSPSFMFQTLSGADEIQVQGMAGYLFDQQRDITLSAGLGYRLSDALQALLGVKYKNLRVGFAYDINTSDLTAASNYRGGFELAANYIVKIYKNPVIKTKILCPRF